MKTKLNRSYFPDLATRSPIFPRASPRSSGSTSCPIFAMRPRLPCTRPTCKRNNFAREMSEAFQVNRSTVNEAARRRLARVRPTWLFSPCQLQGDKKRRVFVPARHASSKVVVAQMCWIRNPFTAQRILSEEKQREARERLQIEREMSEKPSCLTVKVENSGMSDTQYVFSNEHRVKGKFMVI